MKKLSALLLAAVMLLGMTAMAEPSLTTEELRALAALCVEKMDSFAGLAEVSTMLEELSDADLLKLYGLCASEMARRNADAGNIWYQSEDGSLTIVITGMTMTRLNGVELQINFEILNSTDQKVSFRCNDVAVNGWETSYASSGAANPYRNRRDTLQFTHLDSDVGWSTPREAADNIQVMVFDLVITIGSDKITIPMTITDFSGMKVVNK